MYNKLSWLYPSRKNKGTLIDKIEKHCHSCFIEKAWIIAFSFFLVSSANAQQSQGYRWWNPATNEFPVIEGQYWPKEVKNTYDRFPERAQKTLNPNVWNISHSSAGLYLKFKTDADDITVRYVVSGGQAMSHMPATGVSGIDLYALDPDGNWHWAAGKFSFGDTIEYRFSHLEISKSFPGKNYEYRLYLPLYNTVSWMQIGVSNNKNLIPIPLSIEKPVVVYGTSIAQGACATRPGMAWTSILERKLNRPLINLGFSGSGKLETSVIDLMTEIDASIYVLDCLPNLTAGAGFSNEEVEKRIFNSITLLQNKHPDVPILLTEHCGGTTNSISDKANLSEYENVNKVLRLAYTKLQAKGIRNVYLLSNTEINFDINSTVDGLHPNDVGMEKYASAYEKSIRSILHEPIGKFTTTIPVVQSRDGYYDWQARHREILLLNKTEKPANVILGNSIIHYWGGTPKPPLTRGADSWNKYMEPLGVRNLGFGWDKIENVLWRIYHDELDGYTAKHVVVMIGTNNLTTCNDEEIIAGLKMIVEAIKIRQPNSSVLLSGILPRIKMEKRIVTLNESIAKLATILKVQYINPGKVLLNSQKTINESLFEDGLHPNTAGYQKLAQAMEPLIKTKELR